MQRSIAIFFGFVSLVLVAACAKTEAPPAPSQGFIAIITGDIAVSEPWYASVFDLERKKWLEGEGYKIALLMGADAMIEIIEFAPQAPDSVNRSKGIFKAGFVISDFDEKIAKWRADGVAFMGDGGVFYDDAMGYHSTILLDPDGNRIQVFGNSARNPT